VKPPTDLPGIPPSAFDAVAECENLRAVLRQRDEEVAWRDARIKALEEHRGERLARALAAARYAISRVLFILLAGVLADVAWRLASPCFAWGTDARRNAEAEALRFVRALRPGTAGAGAACTDREEAGGRLCLAWAGDERIRLACDTDPPGHNDGCHRIWTAPAVPTMAQRRENAAREVVRYVRAQRPGTPEPGVACGPSTDPYLLRCEAWSGGERLLFACDGGAPADNTGCHRIWPPPSAEQVRANAAREAMERARSLAPWRCSRFPATATCEIRNGDHTTEQPVRCSVQCSAMRWSFWCDGSPSPHNVGCRDAG
jgi:hypothetical protein